MKILIAGHGKSGTTALFYKIKNSLGKTRCLFEPCEYKLDIENNNDPIIAKILLLASDKINYQSFEGFDKKILIVRDPRDQLISWLLYSVYESNFFSDEKKVEKFVNILKKKEHLPKTVSVLDIIRLYDNLSKETNRDSSLNSTFLDNLMAHRYFAMKYHDKHPDYFVIKYEDLVDNKLNTLENYLGFKLCEESSVDKSLKRVIRTKSYGTWMDWFIEEDVMYFRPLFSDFIEKYEYSNDWRLNTHPSILPKHASKYVISIVQEKIERQSRKNYKPFILRRLGKFKQIFGSN